MRRAVIIILALLAVTVGSLIVLQRQGVVALPLPPGAGEGGGPRSGGESPEFDAIDLTRGTIASTVSATGNIQPEAEVSLSFDNSGRVTQVLVTAGQPVREGQLLAQLDIKSFQLARDEALVEQKIAQSRLGKLLVEVDEDDITLARARINVAQAMIVAAEANLNARRIEHQTLLAGLSASDRAVMEAELRQAESAVDEARSNYEQTQDKYRVTDPELEAAQSRITQADAAAKASRARLDSALDPPTAAEVASSEHLIAQGEESLRQAYARLIEEQNALGDLEKGPSVEDIDIARSELEQSRISYERAQLNIQKAQLLAPRDGVISTVNVRVGELYSGTVAAMILSDLNSYHMKVQVDEIDVRQVQLGQEVRLVLDALPDTDIIGRVTRISPTANEVGSTITYEVEIVPDPTDAPLRAGMSATAIITTARVDNVLLIPNRYVRFDRDKNKYFVHKVVNDAPVLQEIRIGLRNERQSQILAGLTDTDQVALLAIDREGQLRSVIFGGGG